jgi:hypothetical protein
LDPASAILFDADSYRHSGLLRSRSIFQKILGLPAGTVEHVLTPPFIGENKTHSATAKTPVRSHLAAAAYGGWICG